MKNDLWMRDRQINKRSTSSNHRALFIDIHYSSAFWMEEMCRMGGHSRHSYQMPMTGLVAVLTPAASGLYRWTLPAILYSWSARNTIHRAHIILFLSKKKKYSKKKKRRNLQTILITSTSYLANGLGKLLTGALLMIRSSLFLRDHTLRCALWGYNVWLQHNALFTFLSFIEISQSTFHSTICTARI